MEKVNMWFLLSFSNIGKFAKDYHLEPRKSPDHRISWSMISFSSLPTWGSFILMPTQFSLLMFSFFSSSILVGVDMQILKDIFYPYNWIWIVGIDLSLQCFHPVSKSGSISSVDFLQKKQLTTGSLRCCSFFLYMDISSWLGHFRALII